MPTMHESLYTIGGLDFTYLERCTTAGTIKWYHLAMLGNHIDPDIYVCLDVTLEQADDAKAQRIDHRALWQGAKTICLYNADERLHGPDLTFEQVEKYCPRSGVYLSV